MATDTETKELAERPPQRLTVVDDSAFRDLLDTARFEHLWRVARLFAESDLVPTQFQRKPGNCFVALQMAIRLSVDPFMFLQGCYVVHGRPGLESKLAIALANRSGVFSTGIAYRMSGQGMAMQCTASAVRKDTDETVEETVTMAMAKAEGWIDKPGSKWKTMPEIMLKYRAAMFLIRLNCPEILMGMSAREELEDIESRTIDAVAAPRSLEGLTSRLLVREELREEPAKDPDPEPEPEKGEPEQGDEQAPADDETLPSPMWVLFDDCSSLTDVGAREKELIEGAGSDEQAASISAAASAARDRIRATRGPRSNGK